MIRSILIAAVCLISLSQTAFANKPSAVNCNDPGLIECKAGRSYASEKKSGSTCPYANKQDREVQMQTVASNGTQKSERPAKTAKKITR